MFRELSFRLSSFMRKASCAVTPASISEISSRSDLGGAIVPAGSLAVTRHRSFISSISAREVMSFPAIRHIVKCPFAASRRSDVTVIEPSGNASRAASASCKMVVGVTSEGSSSRRFTVRTPVGGFDFNQRKSKVAPPPAQNCAGGADYTDPRAPAFRLPMARPTISAPRSTHPA